MLSHARSIVLTAVLVSLAAHRTASAQPGWLTPIAPPATIIELPMDPDAAREHWSLGTQLTAVQDELLGRTVLEANAPNHPITLSKPVEGPCEVVALVRIVDGGRQMGVSLNYGRTGSGSAEYDFSLSALALQHLGPQGLHVGTRLGTNASAIYLQQQGLRRDSDSQSRLPSVTYFRPRFHDISPVWDPDFRQEIESAMAQAPVTKDSWIELRIVHRPDVVQFYRDGFFIGETAPGGLTRGELELRIMGHIRIGTLAVRELPAPTAPFVPVAIDAHATGAVDELNLNPQQLPAPGTTGVVHGIPFAFPAGEPGHNVVDVGQSLFRYRNRSGQLDGNQTWPAPELFDPGRIRFSVPNRAYTRLWVIAAAEDNPDNVPLITVRFYRPNAGFPIDAEARVPLVTAKGDAAGARRLSVGRAAGKDTSLWLIPVELDSVRIASEFREEPTLSMEITKQVFPWRSYPDPSNYSWFQGGLPSGVRLFAITLEQAPVRMIATSNRTGNAFVAPEQPVWLVKLQNQRPRKISATVHVGVRDPEGRRTEYVRDAVLAPSAATTIEIPMSPTSLGLHDVTTTIELSNGGSTARFTQTGTFIQLPTDTRHSNVRNARWGLWNWGGAHLTNADDMETLYLNRAAGARFGRMATPAVRAKWGVRNGPTHLIYGPEPWATKDPYDQAEYDAFADRIGKRAAEMLAADPDTPSFSIFTETAISERVTYGVPPEYLGEGELVMTDEEKARYRAFWVTLKAACEGIRKHAPQAKIALGWCEPIFAVPFLKDKFPPELFDMIGVDSPQFERMPEMPIREVAPSRMWMLKEAMKKYGYADKPVIHTESYYPSSHPLALGFRGSADSYVRTAVLSLAQGTSIFANCWTLYDCGNYWGNQHYGCIGIVGRRPEYNPKPAFAAFATMTRLIDTAPFDGFVDTGTQSAYCVRFKQGATYTYCLWTIRGRRPATLRFAKDAQATLIVESGEESLLTLSDNAATVELSPTAVWVRSNKPIESVEPGTPGYSDRPSGPTKLLDTLSTPWAYDPAEYPSYAQNHWGTPRYAGPMKSRAVESAERQAVVWEVALDTPDVERPLAAWYGVFKPAQPVEIPGKARALGVWTNGRSNWGRIIYEIEDAKGEVWQSVGTKNDWNCDDVHSWSSFNFDGWRYIEFPLPNHQPGDNYREHDTVWWNYNADGVVDLPVKLTRIIIEQRTHNVYVDQLVENADRSVQLSELVAVYADRWHMTEAPVELQRRTANLITFPAPDPALLPNPIVSLTETGVGPATGIEKIAPPEHFYDGTRVDVTIKPVEGATEYRVYVAAHESGAGAKQLAKAAEPLVHVTRLRPEFPLYLFVTYVDAAGKESKPSPGTRVLLKDDFPMK